MSAAEQKFIIAALLGLSDTFFDLSLIIDPYILSFAVIVAPTTFHGIFLLIGLPCIWKEEFVSFV